MQIKKNHHVAYRCIDAKQTVEWYGKYLNMGFALAIAEDQVPSTGDPAPYMPVFLDAGAPRHAARMHAMPREQA